MLQNKLYKTLKLIKELVKIIFLIAAFIAFVQLILNKDINKMINFVKTKTESVLTKKGLAQFISQNNKNSAGEIVEMGEKIIQPTGIALVKECLTPDYKVFRVQTRFRLL